MKIMIVSDTHRKHENFEKALEKEGQIDLLIHLGDVEGAEYYISQVAGCKVEMVSGNNDFFSSLEREKEIDIAGYRALLTHGHYYNVNLGVESILEEGRARNVDFVMFGHTHRPHLQIEEDIVVLNPGSISYPRQEGKKHTYMVMEIHENEKPIIQLKSVE